MIERSLTLTFRHLTTLFLLVALVSTPLQVAYAVAFRDVIAVSDLHERIAGLPEGREIGGVDSSFLAESRAYFLLVEAIEVLAVVLLVGAVIAVLEDEERGRIPKIGSALRGIGRYRPTVGFSKKMWVSIAGCTVIAIVVGYLTEMTLLALADLVSAPDRWAWVAVSRAVARGLSVPFVLMALALASRAKGKMASVPNLY